MTTAVTPASFAPVPFVRLARVELRKLVDTRGSRALLAVLASVGLAVVTLVVITSDPGELTYFGLASAAGFTQALLLPVLGILAVTSEWTQRTALTTFVLQPRRGRVAGAKVVASLALAMAAVLVVLIAGAVTHVLAIVLRGAEGSWQLEPAAVAGVVALQLLGLLQGVAFGLAFQHGALSVVAYFGLPTAWTLTSTLAPGLADIGRWLDLSHTTAPLLAGRMSAGDWWPLLVGELVWIGVPLTIGLLRWSRREVS